MRDFDTVGVEDLLLLFVLLLRKLYNQPKNCVLAFGVQLLMLIFRLEFASRLTNLALIESRVFSQVAIAS